MTFIRGKYSNSFIVAATNKFFSCWRVINVRNSCNMILMNIEWSLQITNIETVQTEQKENEAYLNDEINSNLLVIFICSCEYKCFEWIPSKCA